MVAVETRQVRPDQYTVEVSSHLCECGCGERTMVAPRTINSRGVKKGDARRFVWGHQFVVARVEYNARRRALAEARAEARRLVRVVRVPRRRVLVSCICGCGELAPRGRKLIDGHRRRGKLRVAVRWVAEDRGFDTPCWIWQLSVDAHEYGRVTVRGRKLKAHRVAFEQAGGVIPPGYELHHRCEVKLCVNPAHLEPLTSEAHGQLHGEVWRRAA